MFGFGFFFLFWIKKNGEKEKSTVEKKVGASKLIQYVCVYIYIYKKNLSRLMWQYLIDEKSFEYEIY